MFKERIRQEFGTEVIDENKFNGMQLEVIWMIMSYIPKNLYCLHKIFAKGVHGYGQIPFWICVPALNIGRPENQFPNDITPKYSDLFSMIFVHELNHQVFKHYIEPDETLLKRHTNLIKAAGTDRLQYLRGHISEMVKSQGAFFLNAPQEFFASISNQWFSSSFITLELALSRFREGRNEPINQFLFFADIYSSGEKCTRFYELDVKGNLSRHLVKLSRNQNNHIDSMTVNETRYQFSIDKDGNVLEIKY